MDIRQILQLNPLIPVVTLADPRQAIPLARALNAGGVRIIEVTLRNNKAFEVIRAIRENVKEIVVGAGTVVDPDQVLLAQDAGAQFMVSPGFTPQLVTAANKAALPYMPGVMTPCEILAAQQMNLTVLKFFPAELSGGVKMLKVLQPLFPKILFCPTGGISRTNMKDYLNLTNVIAVGGTWLAPENLLEKNDWDAITNVAQESITSMV